MAKGLPQIRPLHSEEGRRFEQLEGTPLPSANETMTLSEEQLEQGKVLVAVVMFLKTQREQLTFVAQQRLLELIDIAVVLAEGSDADEATVLQCYKKLLSREVQQELVNMGNQLGINLQLSH